MGKLSFLHGHCSVTEHRPHGKEEQEIFDMQQGTRDVWDRCVVTAYFSPGLNVSGAVQASEASVAIPSPAQISAFHLPPNAAIAMFEMAER